MPMPTPHLKNLRDLLEGVVANAPDVAVTDITIDSRAVRAGSAFVAVPGLRSHGLSYAEQAIANGALTVLYEPVEGVDAPSSTAACTVVPIHNLTQHLGAIADRFFDAPSAVMSVIGVTGTNGKTTSAYLLPEALAMLQRSAGYAGTLGYGHVDALRSSPHTTADCITVHRQLASMRDAGDRYVGMEVSSHALDQGRIDGVRFHSALFTNLTRDHLDYHGTLEAYGEAKEKLFRRAELRHCAINADDEFGRDMIARLAKNEAHPPITAFSKTACHSLGDRQLFATHIELAHDGVVLSFDGSWGAGRLRSQLIGAFNAENLLGVLAVLLGLDVSLAQAVEALNQCHAPPGRMETLTAANKPLVVIDYAHSPDALAKALQTARAHARGKLLCVFGCGGDRDAGKRPLMGAIAEQHADIVILTDDNPRTEDGDGIITDIMQGLDRPTAVIVERDRAAAIARAIRTSSADDLVLIAGKGHEDYQIVGRNVKRFSDREEAQKILRGAT